MVECPNCRASASRDAKFCGECGQPLVRPCPDCGKDTPVVQDFCTMCGVRLVDADHRHRNQEMRVAVSGTCVCGACGLMLHPSHREIGGDLVSPSLGVATVDARDWNHCGFARFIILVTCDDCGAHNECMVQTELEYS